MAYDAFDEYERSMWEPRAGSFESLTDGDVVALSVAAVVASATAP
jgi:hypothetical protein